MSQEIFLLLLQVLLKYGPQAVISIKEILSKPTVSDSDWANLIALIQKPYDSYIK